MKKLMSCFLTICFIFVSTMPVFAAESIPERPSDSDYGAPIKQITYFDEDLGVNVTERIYFVPDQPGISLRSKSGSGWYKNEGYLSWDGGESESTKIYAEGYFVWGEGDIKVSSTRGGYDRVPSNATVTSSKVTSGTGNYGGVLNKYAYVTYTISAKNVVGQSRTKEVTIRVSESGNAI